MNNIYTKLCQQRFHCVPHYVSTMKFCTWVEKLHKKFLKTVLGIVSDDAILTREQEKQLEQYLEQQLKGEKYE